MHARWVLLKIDCDESGEPIVEVLKVFEGPTAETDAYRFRNQLMASGVFSRMSYITRIAGDVVRYEVKKVKEPSKP